MYPLGTAETADTQVLVTNWEPHDEGLRRGRRVWLKQYDGGLIRRSPPARGWQLRVAGARIPVVVISR